MQVVNPKSEDNPPSLLEWILSYRCIKVYSTGPIPFILQDRGMSYGSLKGL
jgi:hypothetical protein